MRRLLIKLKLFIPYFLVVVVAVSLLTVLTVRQASREIRHTIEQNLMLEVQTISRLFDREYSLKMDQVQTSLAVFHAFFYAHPLHITGRTRSMSVTHQLTGSVHTTRLPAWTLGGVPLEGNEELVDSMARLMGGTFTIFQRCDSGFVRIATNVPDNNGRRATGTFIPMDSPVSMTILEGKSFTGRAYVVNSWYITAYEPILFDGKVIGMLYAGNEEKEIRPLRELLNSLTIGKTGYVFAIDANGQFKIHPELQDKPVPALLLDRIGEQTKGIISMTLPDTPGEQTIAFQYFEPFRLTICAAIDLKAESQALTGGIIRDAILTATVAILLLSLLLFLYTTRTIHRYLEQLEKTDKQLVSAWKELEQSANRFRTLFNNSSDEIFVEDFSGRIIEVNEVACTSLGYTREELIGKRFQEIKTENYVADVEKNLEMIRHFGQHRYETENLTRAGKVVPVEMKSRVVEYDGEKRILSIARDITERKEMEERILKAIIATEESERKRFAADLHDDLGPILSTIKLYTGLLKKQDQKAANRKETVANIDELVELAIRTSRDISNRIRPNVLQDFGLGPAITEFCSFINQTGSLSIDVRSST